MRKIPAAWLYLALILALFLAYLGWIGPGGSFGWYHDDTVYFSTAQSLAQGHGYRMPSVPGAPYETKYPGLYPWLLSWIWRWWPLFPANVAPAVWMTALFGCVFLAAAFQLLRRLAGFGDWRALLLVALCAFHAQVLFLSGAVLSDVPFTALALAAAVVADAALDHESHRSWPLVVAAVLAGLSVLTRGFGLAVIAGIAATAIYRRAFRRAAVFCLVAAPFVVGPLVWSALHAPTVAAAAGTVTGGMPAAPGGEPGWIGTWLYYTSYGGFWKLCVPNVKVLSSVVMRNLRSLLEQPASYCLFPPLGDGRPLGTMFCITLSVWILSGVVRQARADRWRPIHFIFPFNAAMAVGWNYGLMDRFLLLFLPLFYAGLWVEAGHFFNMLRTNFRGTRPASDRVLAAILMAALSAVGLLAANDYLRGFRPELRALAAKRAALGQEKGELYEWIRQNTDPGARFVAYEDVSLYLHTGRQAMRPIAFSTEAFYMEDEGVLKRDLMHITDVARHIRARYWVVSSDDFDMETGTPLVDERMGQLKSVLPLVFRSHNGKVQLYDLGCLLDPDRTECGDARRLLLPTESTL
ncbi:MAG TPA: hypothetical protein VEU62_15195 [Bryobacterales bacterium]|nr:hypothetical protein [Bryobacterales bacterium]